MTRIRVKICCMASPDEAALAASAGADLVGLVGPMPSGAGIVSPERCREIADRAPAWASPVLLSSAGTAGEIARDVIASGVKAVQIVRHVAPGVHDELAERLPAVRRFQVVHVEDATAVERISSYAGRIDAFLLDSGRPGRGELGGTGRIHDWSVSASFVRASPVPVFLAGGLDPLNVAAAIARVRPFGVDVCTGVRTGDRLDQSKLAAFFAAIRKSEQP